MKWKDRISAEWRDRINQEWKDREVNGMSHYHVLEQSADGRMAKVVYHLAIPAASNEAGISYRTIAVWWKMYHEGDLTSVVPNIDPSEQTQMDNGEILEHVKTYGFSSPDLTPIQKRDELDTDYNATKDQIFTKYQVMFEWYGLARDVP